MVASSLIVANMALGLLDEAPITALDQDNKPARLCNLHYDQTVESELTKHSWVFAIVSAEVTGTDLGTDAGTLNWSYAVPAGALRVLPLTHNGEPDGIPISWRREGDVILTDQSSPRTIRYIDNVTNTTEWPALFTDVVAGALAAKIALPLTHKAGMVEIARNAYNGAVAEARRVNAMEKAGTLYLGGWDTLRGDNRYGWR